MGWVGKAYKLTKNDKKWQQMSKKTNKQKKQNKWQNKCQQMTKNDKKMLNKWTKMTKTNKNDNDKKPGQKKDKIKNDGFLSLICAIFIFFFLQTRKLKKG